MNLQADESAAGAAIDDPGDRVRRSAGRLVPGRGVLRARLPVAAASDLVHARDRRRADELLLGDAICQDVPDLAGESLQVSPVNVVEAKALVGPWKWDDRSMYFHATWRQLTNVRSFREGTTKPEEGAYDVNFVEVTGQGVYVGDTLTVFNGADAWWGEGDEKIFVDGEAFPVPHRHGHRGLYGYAWCRPEFFSSPFHAQPNGAGNLHGRLLGQQPISCAGRDSLHEVLEVRHGAVALGRTRTSTMRRPLSGTPGPGRPRMSKPDPETAALPVAVKQIVSRCSGQGALEGEDLKMLEKTGGTLEKQTGSAVPLEQRDAALVAGWHSRARGWCSSSRWRRRDATKSWRT